MTVAEVVDRIVRLGMDSGDAVALVQPGGRRLSYGDLATSVRNAARNLSEAGLAPGDRVLFAVRPGPEAIILILAILYAGGVIVAADLSMGDEVFHARMALARPTWVVAESVLLGLSAWQPVRALLRGRGVLLPPLTGMPGCRVVGVGWRWPGVPRDLDFSALQRRPAAAGVFVESRPDPAANAFIVFTSGTTDAPKAVVHSHASLGRTLDILATHLALAPTDVVYSADLHAIIPALLAGARVVLPDRRSFDPRGFLRMVNRQRVTHAFGTPTDFQRVVEYLQPTNRKLPGCLRVLLLGSAPAYTSFLAHLREVVPPHTSVWCVYALSEMLPVARVSIDEKLAYTGPGDLVGAPVEGVSVRLDTDGELLLRGPHMFRGYLGQTTPANEIRTGDLASLDESGRIVLRGRKKDMFIRAGRNVYPGLVEPIIAAIPGVRQCSLVGLYDDRTADERIVLAVEVQPGQDERSMQRRLRAELAAGPHAIDPAARPDAIVITPIPRVGRSLKVDRQALQQQLRQRVPPC